MSENIMPPNVSDPVGADYHPLTSPVIPSAVGQTPLTKIWHGFYIFTLILGIISLSYYLLLNPMQASGQNLLEVFEVDGYIFSERISYLTREPAAGDAVIFKAPQMNGFGIIVGIKDTNNIKTYQVISTTTQQTPREITRDKILSRIYYPSVRGLDLSMTPLPSPTPIASTKPTTFVEEGNKEVAPIITTPVSKSVIKSPVTIKGTVPSGWMFEGQFPIEIRTIEGKLLGVGIAQEIAPGDWSSGNEVDFTATVTFEAIGKTGTIVILSDNPSGDPKNQKKYSYGIFFE